MKFLIVLAVICIAVAVADDVTCMYGIDNSDAIFTRFNPYNGSITTLASIPDNSSARVSATFNAIDKQYILVSQLASTTNDDGLSLITVDVTSGKVISNIAFGSVNNFPRNLAYSSSAQEVFALYTPSSGSESYVVSINTASGAVQKVSEDILMNGKCTTVFQDQGFIDEKRGTYYIAIRCNGADSIVGVNLLTGATTTTAVSKAPLVISSDLNVEPSTGFIYVEVTNQTDFSANLFSVNTQGGQMTHVCGLGALAYAWAVDWQEANPVYYRGTQVPFTHPNRFEIYTLKDGKGPTYKSLNTFGLVFSLHLFHASADMC